MDKRKIVALMLVGLLVLPAILMTLRSMQEGDFQAIKTLLLIALLLAAVAVVRAVVLVTRLSSGTEDSPSDDAKRSSINEMLLRSRGKPTGEENDTDSMPLWERLSAHLDAGRPSVPPRPSAGPPGAGRPPGRRATHTASAMPLLTVVAIALLIAAGVLLSRALFGADAPPAAQVTPEASAAVAAGEPSLTRTVNPLETFALPLVGAGVGLAALAGLLLALRVRPPARPGVTGSLLERMAARSSRPSRRPEGFGPPGAMPPARPGGPAPPRPSSPLPPRPVPPVTGDPSDPPPGSLSDRPPRRLDWQSLLQPEEGEEEETDVDWWVDRLSEDEDDIPF